MYIDYFKNLKNADYVILQSDIKNITLYYLILACKIKNIPCSLWGHALFKKNYENFFIRCMYKLIYKYYGLLIDKYICYNSLVKKSLSNINFDKKKIIILNNTLQKERNFEFSTKKKSSNILFIGRLRRRSNIHLLLKSIKYLEKEKIYLGINIIGNGVEYKNLKILGRKLDLKINFFGEIYNSKKIKTIAEKCFVGVYPGDCGLSIVDYFFYGLPVVVHSNHKMHMGPEPYYLKKNFNGLHFKRNDLLSLSKAIKKLYLNNKINFLLSKNSFNTFNKLNDEKLSKKIYKLINICKWYISLFIQIIKIT